MNKPLSLWNKTHTRQVILDFVAAVHTRSGEPPCNSRSGKWRPIKVSRVACLAAAFL